MPPTATPVRPAALAYPEAAQYLAVGLTTFKKLVRDGEILTIGIGRRKVVRTIELDAFLQRQLESAR